MTHAEQVEVVAEEIRKATERYLVEFHGSRGLEPWVTLPDSRKIKYRMMAQAAIEVMRS